MSSRAVPSPPAGRLAQVASPLLAGPAASTFAHGRPAAWSGALPRSSRGPSWASSTMSRRDGEPSGTALAVAGPASFLIPAGFRPRALRDGRCRQLRREIRGRARGGLGREGRCGPPRRGASRGGAARGPWAAWPRQRRRWHRAPAHVSGGLPRVPWPDAVSPRCQEGLESHLVPETTGEGRFLAGVPAEAQEARRTLRPPVSASELSHRTGVA